jgi:outer membrane protein TolC
LSSLSIGLQAQQTYQLDLKQAIDLGLKNSIEIKNLNLDYNIQEQKNKELTAAIYPNINASAGLTYYTNVPQIQFPSSNLSIYQVLNKEGVTDKNGNVIDESKSTFTVNNLSFIQPWNSQFGISVNQLLFQPDVFVGLQARKTILKFNQNNTDASTVNVKEKIYKSYFGVLISQKQLAVVISTKERLTSLLNEMEEMYKAGFAEILDVERLKVSLNNTESAQNQIANGIKIGMASFKSVLGIDQKDSISLTQDFDINEIKESMLMTDHFNYEKRKEIVTLNTALELQAIDLKRYKLSYLPSLSAVYNFQRSGQRNPSFAEITGKPWFWFNTGFVGLQINQPLYNGNIRKFKINQVQFETQKIENNLTLMKQYIDLEQEAAKSSLNNAMINMEVQQRNITLAQEVFNKTKLKYQNGLGSSFEVIQSDTELQRAQGNYFQAIYEAMIAKVNFDKAFGIL